MNFANADMVGHTGNYEAAVKAMEALDQCLARVVGAAQATVTSAGHRGPRQRRGNVRLSEGIFIPSIL